MIHFITIHLKGLLTVAFISGLILILIKILDEKLSDERKKRFDVWIDGFSGDLGSIQTQEVFGWVKRHRVLICFSYVAFVNLFESLIFQALDAVQRKDNQLSIPHVSILMMSIIAGGTAIVYLTGASSWDKAKRRFSEGIRFAVILTFGFVVLSCVEFAFSGSEWLKYLVSPLSLNAAALSVMSSLILLIAPLLVFVVLRVPILICSKAVWWLATYPKGPWAGFIFAATVFFGILRLLF